MTIDARHVPMLNSLCEYIRSHQPREVVQGRILAALREIAGLAPDCSVHELLEWAWQQRERRG